MSVVGTFALLNTEAWVEQAVCASTDPEQFFPEKGNRNREAKQMCAQCPVRKDCLGYALDRNEQHGIWGGYSDRERRQLRRDKRIA